MNPYLHANDAASTTIKIATEVSSLRPNVIESVQSMVVPENSTAKTFVPCISRGKGFMEGRGGELTLLMSSVSGKRCAEAIMKMIAGSGYLQYAARAMVNSNLDQKPTTPPRKIWPIGFHTNSITAQSQMTYKSAIPATILHAPIRSIFF